MTRRVDNQSKQSPLTKLMEQSFSSLIRQCMFTLPGRVTGFDPETQLAQIEWGINRLDGEGNSLPTPVVDEVPVVFAGDGEWYFFHQITPGETEGLIHFSQRAIDTWIGQGGPVDPHERRYLSEEDAFFVPGARSRPGAIPNFKNDGAGVSNYAQTSYTHHKSDGTIETVTDGPVTVEASGGVEVTADTTINGNLDVDGNITATGNIESDGNITAAGDVVAGTISLQSHVHGGVASGQSTTSPPQ